MFYVQWRQAINILKGKYIEYALKNQVELNKQVDS